MEDLVSTSAGLNSLSGFSFQIKVFILMMTQLTDGKCVEFETLDDVVVKDIPSNDKVHDICIKTCEKADGSIVAFQVKQTKVTDVVARTILYNWLLALSKNPSISSFELLIDDGYVCTSKVFSNPADKEYKIIMESCSGKNALVTRIKSIYEDNLDSFRKDFEYICNHHCRRQITNIEHEIAEKLCLPFHSAMSDADNPHFSRRIKELIIRVCARIMECAGNRIPYICTYAEYLQLCEEICKNISEEQYNPDYDSFKTVCMSDEIDESVKNSREYKQLSYCRLTDADQIEHLRWEQYYQNIRKHLLADAKKGQIRKTEDIAYRNFTDVVISLQEDDRDTPRRRLVNTKTQPISTLSDEYSRWGAYVFLTRDNSEKQISWKDEEGENVG